MAWYNKYRPSNFAQTSGQSLVKRVLQNSVKTIFTPNPKVKHAYLLSGPRGTGKTSLARIFAKSINCLDQDFIEKNGEACGVCDVCKNGQIDIIELDAASNTGIDNIRDLIEAANTPPFISRYKIYIIDEVHMLSKSAMNALLKTLEEPPSYIVFLMATTDPEKILNTILSRVTHLKLINHTIEDISKVLVSVSKLENLNIDIPAIQLIAKIAKGGLRDAINLLETVSNYNLENYSEAEVAEILGVLPSSRLENLARNLTFETFKELKNAIDEFESLGSDPEMLLTQLLDYLLSQTLENYLETEVTNLEFDDLIKVLAEILSNRLPLGSIQSTLTLVKIRLQKNTQQISPNPSPQSTTISTIQPILKNDVTSAEQKKPEDALEISLKDQIPSNSQAESKKEAKSLKKIDDASEDVTTSQFGKLIESNLSDPDFPMMLKTFWQNIQTFEDSENLYLYLPNKTFILPLKSTKITDWLKNLMLKNFPEPKIIRIVTDDDIFYFDKIKALLKVNQTQNLTHELEQINKTPLTSFEPKLEKSEPSTKSDSEPFKLSDFYYLYAALPDGSVPEGMKLLSQKPDQNTKPANQEHWGNELADLDLE